MPSQTAGRYLRMVFVFVLLVSLIFSNTGLMSVSKVYAQDQEPTPTPEVTLIESPVVTEEPTAVPAQPSGSLPNLSLIAPEGWDAAVVLSPIIGTHVTGTLTDGEVAYLDLAVFNQGSDIAGTFAVCLKIDGEQVQCWEANSLPAGEYFTVEDWAYTANRGAGSHHFELTVDANNMVTESDETDNTWVFDFTWLPSEMAGQSTGSPLINDVFQRPDLPDMQSQSATGSNLPGPDDVSPYMIGSIAVGVILPESSGTDENWTTTERNQVYDEIKEGLDRWVDWSKSNNSNTNSDNVDANVSFVYDYQYAISTSVEPILTSSEDQCTWINEVMTNMGYTNPNGCWYQIYDYLDDLRTSTGTDWATAIFVVDSSVDDDGKFTNGYFGYAYFHGPFIVMTYDNDGWGIGSMDQVTQHEMAHIFGAGDNYYQEGYGGCENQTDLYGYLGIPNSNCVNGPLATDTDVLMNNNNTARIHWTSQQQVGWKDSDGDRIADVVDTLPKFSLGKIKSDLTVTGVVYDEPYPTSTYKGGRNITVNKITSARYKIDSGSWQSMIALDGSFNSDHEDIVPFSLGTPANGTHTLYVEGTNSRGNKYETATNFTIPLAAPANDRLTNPTVMTQGTNYTQSTEYATITTDEPVNVCNTRDTGSVWYSFTAPSTGVYKLNIAGSNYSPNLSVVRKVSSTSRTPVVCGETDLVHTTNTELAFNATAGYTYLFEVSDKIGGGALSLKVEKPGCSTDELCGAFVGGDGRVVRYPTFNVLDSNNNNIGFGDGDYSGFIKGNIYSGSGNYKVVTSGNNNLILTNNVPIPGYYAPSAMGLRKTKIDLRDTSENDLIADDIVLVSSSNRSIGGSVGDNKKIVLSKEIYATPGSYNLLAASSDIGLEVYWASIPFGYSDENEVSTILSAKYLKQDTFSFDLDGISESRAYLYSPDYYGLEMEIGSGRTITFAAEEGTDIPFIQFLFSKNGDPGLTWNYTTILHDPISIQGGQDHPYQIGGTLSVQPYASNAPIRLDEGSGQIYAGVKDAYDNEINEIFYYGDAGSGVSVKTTKDRAQLIERLTTTRTMDGKILRHSLINPDVIYAQDWVYEDIVPIYTVTDKDSNPVVTDPVYFLGYPLNFVLSSSSAVGTWNVTETIDLGPYGGEKSGSASFGVYSTDGHSLANDDFNAALNISTFPFSITLDTLGATQANDDPIIPFRDARGYASAWFKYIATRDSYLTLDTLGSNYDTVLTVWEGTRGALKNLAYNDDAFEGNGNSSVELFVRTGQTYYIEVTQYTSQFGENPSVQSQEVSTNPKDKIEIQTIGGSLTMNGSELPCYTLSATASPTTNGTVGIEPAPNCLGTKYIEGTEITLTANPKPNITFWKWTNDSTDNPLVFDINAATNLQALLLAVPGTPTLTLPADKGLISHDAVLLKWNPTIPPSSQYTVLVAKDAAFTVDLVTNSTSAVSFVPDWLEPNTTYYWAIRGNNQIDQFGPWSAVRSFRTAILPPGLVDPGDGLDLQTNRPTFDWDDVPGATGYTVQVAKNDTFTQLVTAGTPTGSTYVPLVSLPANITLYWRVQTKAVNGPSRWSAVRRFTVPAGLPVPTLTSPVSGALTTDLTPLLDWGDAVIPSGGNPLSKYVVQISTDSSFSSPVEYEPIISQQEVAPLDPNQTYFWRVMMVDTLNNYSGWSAVRSLRTAVLPPALTSPSHEEDVSSLQPTFDWEEVPGATVYTLQISKNPIFTSLVGTYPTVSAVTEYTPTIILPANVQLWWRVQTKAVNGPSLWSDVRTINMPNPPSVPTLLLPASGALVHPSLNPVLDWSDSKISLVAPGLHHYQVWISDSPSFASLKRNEDPTSSTFTIDGGLLPNKTYYWKVRTYNVAFQVSPWSAVRTFRTAVATPGLTLPGDGVTTQTNRPLFDWEDVTGATGYTIQISRSNTFTSLVTSGSPVGSSYTPTVNLPPTIQLYWRVQAKAVNGPSLWSTPRSFTAPVAPPIPTLVSPLSGSLTTNHQPKLDWADVITPAGTPALSYYDFEITRDINFTDAWASGSSDVSNYTPGSEMQPNTTYYWHVRAVDVSGNYSGWSLTRSLRTSVLSPVLVSPSNDVTVETLRPMFEWDGVDGATGYSLQISKDAGFTKLVGTYTTNPATTEYTPVVNLPAGIQIYWRVQAKAINGPSAWSQVRTLHMGNPPSAPVLTSPANNSTITDKQPTLNWGNSILPVGVTFGKYQLQLANNPQFVSPLYDVEIFDLDNSEFDLPELLVTRTTYYWRVRAFNDLGQSSAWMSTAVFKVGILDTLKVNIGTLPDTLDPQKASFTQEIAHIKQIYEGLTTLDEDLVTVPGAASSWNYNTDATEITFNLRSNLKYSDGSLLNAKRFEYALLRTIDPKTGSEYAGILDDIDGAVEWRSLDILAAPPSQYAYLKTQVKVKAYTTLGVPCTSYTQTNCLTLKIGFKKPSPIFHTIVSTWVTYPVKEEKVVAGGNTWWTKASNHIGNGPFKMVTFNQNGKSTFVANSYYWGGLAKYDLEYSYISNSDEALWAYKAGTLDITPMTADKWSDMVSDPTLNTQAQIYPGSCTYAMLFNQSKPPFTDQKVREAFAYAFDRQEWVDEVLGGMGSPTLTWIPKGFPGYDAAETRWGYNPSQAVAALNASTYGSAAGLPPITATYTDTPRNNVRWTWIRDQIMVELGVNIILNPVDSGTYNTLMGNPATRPQMFILGWCADYPDPQNWLSVYWKSTSPYAQRYGYSNPALDAILNDADSTVDPTTRMDLYADAQTLLMADVPMVTIWNNANTYLVKLRVKNLYKTPLDSGWAGDTVPLSIHIE